MINNGIIKSTCGQCSDGCGVLIRIENGKPVHIEGDPDSPVNAGALCEKGLTSLEYLHNPDRLRYPLKRTGERGQGKWQQISWDDALSIIAKEFADAKNNYGAESVAIIRGANKMLRDDYSTRFANAFGTPNVFTSSYVCFIPRRMASLMTCGFDPFTDHEYPPACIINWGLNSIETNTGEFQRIKQALDKGTKFIVIDPRKADFTTKADLLVQLRPGSDLALALAMINAIINERLFDKDFVEKWTVGFDQLRDHIQDYHPEKVEDITWVPARMIKEVARFYAVNKPACIKIGNATDHNINSFQVARAISILRAITGNLGIPGGEVSWTPPRVQRANTPQMSLQDNIPAEKRRKRLGGNHTMPIIFFGLPQILTRSILEEEPYPIRVAYVQGCNPLLSWPNAQETHRALMKLPFLAVADLFMTPTAGLADIVLPVASYLEFDSIVMPAHAPVAQVQQKVTEIEECWPDFKILNEMAKKLSLESYLWENIEKFLDTVLQPSGLTFTEFREVGMISGSKRYKNYQENGFETPSGKVELYSPRLKEWGFDPLPTYHEFPETPYSNPELVKEYPLILSSFKREAFRHSEGKQIATLRHSRPDPVVGIHPDTAGKLGIKDDDQVYIETKRGRVRQKANLTTGTDPKVVWVDYGWWFPEKGVKNLYGWAESNINVLTDNKPPFGPEMGSANLRGILCKVYKA